MLKFLSAVAILWTVSTSLAYSQYSPHHHHHHHHYNGGSRSTWVAPFVGGAIVGALGTALITPGVYAPPPFYTPICRDRFTGYYDTWGRPILQRVCE